MNAKRVTTSTDGRPSGKARRITRLMFRGFAGGVRQFEERVEIDHDQLDELATLAARYGLRLGAFPRHMIEIEFLDEPDVYRRFFRLGTDQSQVATPWPMNGYCA